jgi:SPP1 family predicted phage head-tail adaptor
MTFDYEIKLLTITYTTSSTGDSIENIIEKPVLADLITYKTKDFYQALSNGLKPSKTFGINKYEYDNQVELIFEGQRYKIIDVSPINPKDESEFDAISLIVEGPVI